MSRNESVRIASERGEGQLGSLVSRLTASAGQCCNRLTKPEARTGKSISIRHMVALALLCLCGLLSPSRASANDLQSGDLLLGAADFIYGGADGAILLVRNGAISVFCESPISSADPHYFSAPTGVIADSQGNVVFLAAVGGSGALAVVAPGIALFSCSGIGATPQPLAYFPSTSTLEPGYTVPVVPGVLSSGETFSGVSGLHLLSLHTASVTDLAAGVKTQDAYSMVVGTTSAGAVSLRYRTSDQIWEADTQVLQPRLRGRRSQTRSITPARRTAAMA